MLFLLTPQKYVIACTGILLCFVVLFLLYSSRIPLPKYRIARATKPGDTTGIPATDLPSIARRHYSFIKKNRSSIYRRPFLSLVIWFDQLLHASGVPISLPNIGILVAIAMAFFTVILERTVKAGLFSTAVVVVPIVGFLVVQVLVRKRTTQLRRFQSVFPEALDLIVRSVRAGLPVSESIRMIGTEVADPVGSSFREVGANLTIGLSLDESLALLEKNAPIPEVRFFTISLTIQQETGGNLAEILSNLAIIMRKRAQIGKKIRALSSEARASALIIGSLPFIVGMTIFFMNREYIEVLYLDETGRIFTFVALASMGLGAIIMAKLIRFEI